MPVIAELIECVTNQCVLAVRSWAQNAEVDRGAASPRLSQLAKTRYMCASRECHGMTCV